MKTTKFQGQASFRSFCSHYCKAPVVLYVGAGISTSRDGEYGLPGWVDLLKVLGKEIAKCEPAVLPPHPWEAADSILEMCVDHLKSAGWEGGDPEQEAELRLQEALWTMIRDSKNCLTQGRKHPHKLLVKEYLRNAWTLRAIAAFCARLVGRSQESDVYRFGANPRVRAVLSGNYDPYLESAATSMFKIPVVKPVAAFGSLAGSLREVPVHHVHGYVPHSGQVEGDEHKPLQEQLVLTRKSYDQAWDEKDVFCATMIPQIFLLRHYTTLFIGFSFTDPKITELLAAIWHEYPESKQKERWNYAIVRDDRKPREQVREELRPLGVQPIFVTNYDEIPELLGAVYTAGLQHDHPDGQVQLPKYAGRMIGLPLKNHQVSCTKIWQMLYTCHQCRPGMVDKL